MQETFSPKDKVSKHDSKRLTKNSNNFRKSQRTDHAKSKGFNSPTNNVKPPHQQNHMNLPQLKLDTNTANIQFATVGLTAPNRSKQAAFQTVGINRNNLQRIEQTMQSYKKFTPYYDQGGMQSPMGAAKKPVPQHNVHPSNLTQFKMRSGSLALPTNVHGDKLEGGPGFTSLL